MSDHDRGDHAFAIEMLMEGAEIDAPTAQRILASDPNFIERNAGELARRRQAFREQVEREHFAASPEGKRTLAEERRAAAALAAQDAADAREELRIRFSEQGWPADLADDLTDEEALRSTGRPVPEKQAPAAVRRPQTTPTSAGSFITDPNDPASSDLAANIRAADGGSTSEGDS